MGIALAAVFVVLAAFHVQWAFAGLPTSIQVTPSIPGRPSSVPSSASCLAVAVALILAALTVLSAVDLLFTSVPRRLRRLACAALGGMFVLRAMGELRLVGFFKSIRDTDFAFWDTWLYSPLCLAIGLSTLWLAASRRAHR